MHKVHVHKVRHRLRPEEGEVAWTVFLSDGYVTSGGCMFNLFDGSRQREEFSRRAPSPPIRPPPRIDDHPRKQM